LQIWELIPAIFSGPSIGDMEKRPELQFILCGSSARKLRHGASNLLGGRASYRTMHPLTLNELSDDYQQKAWKFYFWRTSHGAEVDLLISRGTKLLYAIECKFTNQPSTIK
jgi:predicted AAA+ superfamily ATPase